MGGQIIPQASHEESAEEGELSEGELEDLYEPREDLAGPPTLHVLPLSAPAVGAIREGSIVDSHDTPLYESEVNGQGNGEVVSRVDRDRSGSYSPYLSPREVGTELAEAGDEGMSSIMVEGASLN